MAENENENVFIKCVDCKQRSKLTKWSPWCLSLFLSLSYLSHSLNTRTDSSLLLTCFSHKIVEEMEEKATCPYVRPADV